MKIESAMPIVRVVPFQPHCFAFGGFEVQMSSAMESARAVGANVAPLDFWRSEEDFDILHLWGLELQHSNTIKWAHTNGKKTVVSALVKFPGFRSWLRHLASLALGPARLRKSMLKMIDRITVVNKAQAEYLVRTVGFPIAKVAVIPNLVDDIFFQTGVPVERAVLGMKDYVLCTGNICRRKNQLALVAACKKLGIPVLLVGNTLAGEEEYGRAVEEAISGRPGCHWIKGLKPGSIELARVYRGAAVFALPSYVEVQPISALEAAACRKPLVLADRPYAKQEFYQRAALSNPRSVDSIAGALRRTLDNAESHCPPQSVIEQCRREKVGTAYNEIYNSLA